MNAPTIPTCPLGLTTTDLSAWRDHALTIEDTQRIRAHVPSCDACRRVIAAHGALAFALRADEPPAPDPHNWARLQARIAGRQPQHTRERLTLRLATQPGFWGGLSAVVAVLIISGLFLRLFALQGFVLVGPNHGAPTYVSTPGPAARYVTSLVTARGVDASFNPVNVTSSFLVQSTVYAVMSVAGVSQNQANTLSCVWYLNGLKLDLRAGVQETIPPSRTTDFHALCALPYNQTGVGMVRVYWNRPASDTSDSPNDPYLAQTIKFGILTHLPDTATPTPAPTVAPISTLAPTTPVNGTPLSWQTYAAPAVAVPPPGNGSPDDAFAFAPSDARTAYICAAQNASGSGLFSIWATHDGAHSWKQVATPAGAPPTAQCGVITVDTHDPLRLNILVEDASQQGSPTPISYLSEDGGLTWRALGDDVSLYWLVTRGQTGIAVTAPGDMQGGYIPMPSRAPRLVVSHDGFRSWAPIDAPMVAQGLNVWSVWQRPGDGALLAMAEKRAPNPNGAVYPLVTSSLWESNDMGATWRAFPTPANLNGIPGFIAAQPRGSDPWRVCGLTYPQGSDYLGEVIACTLDGGKTWAPRPLPALRVLCGPTSVCTQLETIDANATLLNNGTLLARFYTGPSSGGVMQSPFTMKVFALPAGSSHWQDLGLIGPIPGDYGTFFTVDTPGAVTLVGYYGPTFTGVLGGQLGNTESGADPFVGKFSFATLP